MSYERSHPTRRLRPFLGGVMLLVSFVCLILLGTAALATLVYCRKPFSLALLGVTAAVFAAATVRHALPGAWRRVHRVALAWGPPTLAAWLSALVVFGVAATWPRVVELAALGSVLLVGLIGAVLSGLFRAPRDGGERIERPELAGLGLMPILALPMAVILSWTLSMKGMTLLAGAQTGDRAMVARGLTGLFAPVDARDAADRTALHHAASAGNVDMVRRLLGQGARRDARDGEGLTPFDHAVKNGHADTAAIIGAQGDDE